MKDIDDILSKANSVIHSVGMSFSQQNAHALALLDLSHEHCKAINSLVKQGLFGSAFSLARCCVESFVRGMWVRVADEKQSKQFLRTKPKWPKFHIMLKDIDERLSGDCQLFTERYKESYGIMSDLTHALSPQIHKRIETTTLRFVASDEELSELLNEVGFISILSNMGMAEIINDQDAVNRLKQVFDEHYK